MLENLENMLEKKCSFEKKKRFHLPNLHDYQVGNVQIVSAIAGRLVHFSIIFFVFFPFFKHNSDQDSLFTIFCQFFLKIFLKVYRFYNVCGSFIALYFFKKNSIKLFTQPLSKRSMQHKNYLTTGVINSPQA